jgi:hypothetical protein
MRGRGCNATIVTFQSPVVAGNLCDELVFVRVTGEALEILLFAYTLVSTQSIE